MKVSELIAELQKHPDQSVEVNIVIGTPQEPTASTATLHPIRYVYKDDAPFCNLNCMFIVADMAKVILRPPLFGGKT